MLCTQSKPSLNSIKAEVDQSVPAIQSFNKLMNKLISDGTIGIIIINANFIVLLHIVTTRWRQSIFKRTRCRYLQTFVITNYLPVTRIKCRIIMHTFIFAKYLLITSSKSIY